MSTSLITSVINAGLDQDLPAFLRKKVQPTNAIALILLFVIAIPFVFITLLFLPKQLAIYPALGGVICIIVLIINYLGGIYYSRLVISLLPISLGAIYNAFLSGESDGPIPSLYLIELSFALIPFVIFDLEEKGFLIFTSVACVLIILTFPITKDWFTIASDSSIIRDGWLGTVTIFLAIISELACVFGLAWLNKQSERHSEHLLKDMDEKATILKDSEVELKENLKKLEAAKLEEQQRNWTSEGIAKLSTILRAAHDNSDTFDKVIAQLVNYLKVNQGGLYVVHTKTGEKENTCIKLAACYAYSRKKYLEQEYAAGQGLIGQAYLEKEYTYLTQIPANYVKITSGLGEATPNSLLIMPLMMNDVVEGIIELASFHPFKPYEIEFVEKIGENIAAYIQTNRINENTKKLLEASQEQAEVLRAQEEEMRQNMEELAATQEEMNRKENEYIKQIEDLKEALNKEIQEKKYGKFDDLSAGEMMGKEKLYDNQMEISNESRVAKGNNE